MSGTLYVVATPIGNLEDITYRAVRVLASVDLIAAEDTRHTRKLLERYEIRTPLTSYHEHNERQKAEALLTALQAGRSVALVSDAGTPGVSDPGYHLIRRAQEEGIPVVPVPGASAFLAAASVSGFPLHTLLFGGFCSPRPGRRRRRLAELASVPATLVFYESPHRLVRFLLDAAEVLGDREAFIAREVTKHFESYHRGRLSALAQAFQKQPPRGELTVVIAPPEGNEDEPTSEELSARECG
ncbi:MAG: ribosomal RNA small subunit methyltransferase I [Candidatus Poribacteria bacterium]|nr:MAG: ribosomal RNA small subunit methyltransferase I [Candidatus Poribacteria bacterium]